jgi:hypothetical protein
MLAASKLYYGLITKGMRSLAYKYSVRIVQEFQPVGMKNGMLLAIGYRLSLNERTHPFSLHGTRPGNATSSSKHSIEIFLVDLCKYMTNTNFVVSVFMMWVRLQ